ncbi:polyhydroxyalkanoate granule-associated phasin [Methylibium sp.]|uniref:polyhydroxyalkanoate granule-associated phasin n=1 Tax=Methylibium sp. TaxID=2067992 RepID=UPI00286B795A|nr:polyhydroxyalkanoate granule-associated phasin [Methylibium sp.]
MTRRSPSVPAFNPFGPWVELTTQSTEMLVASSQVIAQRSARIATSGVNPSLADREEFALMSSEKLEAFSSSAATLASAWTPALQSISEQALHASTAIVSGAWKLAASRTPAELFGRHGALMNTVARRGPSLWHASDTAARLAGVALLPVHRAATANALRLDGRRCGAPALDVHWP